MKFKETSLPDIIIVEPEIYRDDRGYFFETFRENVLKAAGIKDNFVQDNQSRSTKGTLRGLHYQLKQPQGKLVRVSHGKVFDVVVDIRKGSPSFGQWNGTILDDETMRMMYIPPGFAHGFVVLSEIADFIYKCTDYYYPQTEHGIAWNDSGIGIEWPIKKVSLSDKDKSHPNLAELELDKLPEY